MRQRGRLQVRPRAAYDRASRKAIRITIAYLASRMSVAGNRSFYRLARCSCATVGLSPRRCVERRVPSIAAFRENIEAGALISYGVDLIALFRDIAGHVHQIARGAKPSEMPIEQSLRFHMAVNLKTAASLGVSLSDSFVARANEVRE